MFFHIPRIRDLLRGLSARRVHIVVENTLMDENIIESISNTLDCVPFLLDARGLSAASRKRLWWMNLDFVTVKHEEILRARTLAEVKLIEFPNRYAVLDEGTEFDSEFSGVFPCITGWVRRSKPLPAPVGIATASALAKDRWRAEKIATSVFWFENKNMVVDSKTNTHRQLSLLEVGRIMGFHPKHVLPSNQTLHDFPQFSDLMRNALGNAFQVKVVRRCLHSVLWHEGITQALPKQIATHPIAYASMPNPFRQSILHYLRDQAISKIYKNKSH